MRQYLRAIVRSYVLQHTKSQIVVAGLAFVLFVLNVTHLGLSKAGENAYGVLTCVGTTPANAHYLGSVWLWIDAVMYSFAPVSIIFISNIAIIVKMYSRKHELQNGKQMKSTLAANANRMTRMLLVVSTTFLVTTCPSVISALIFPLLKDQNSKDIYLFNAFTVFLMFSNHAFNFFLYCATGQKFREELSKLCRCRKNAVKPISHTGNSGMMANSNTATVNGTARY